MYLRFVTPLLLIAFWACSPSTEKQPLPNWGKVPVTIELRLAEGAPGPGLVSARLYGQERAVYLHPEAELSNHDIVRAEAILTRIGKGVILEVWLTNAGAARIKKVTGSHIGDSLAVLIDSVVVAVPIIREAIGGDPKLPNDIGVPLEPKEAQQLAAAVAKTWPPDRPPSGRKAGKDRK